MVIALAGYIVYSTNRFDYRTGSITQMGRPLWQTQVETQSIKDIDTRVDQSADDDAGYILLHRNECHVLYSLFRNKYESIPNEMYSQRTINTIKNFNQKYLL